MTLSHDSLPHPFTRIWLLLMALVALLALITGTAFAQTPNIPVTVEWSNPAPSSGSGTAVGNKLYRGLGTAACTASAPLTTIVKDLPAVVGAMSYVDGVPNVTQPACYEVSAYNSAGETRATTRASVGVTALPNPPTAPAGLKATVGKGTIGTSTP